MAGNRITIRVRADDDTASTFARIRTAAGQMGDAMNNGLATMSGHAKLVASAIIGIFYALPAALGLVGALLPIAIGAGFIAIAALAFKTDTEVRGAFEQMKDGVVSTVKDAAAPMKGPLIDAMRTVQGEVQLMGPALKGVFEETADATVPLTKALTHFVSSLLPGFKNALTDAEPVFAGFDDGLSSIGDGISNMITMMTSNKEALGEIWREFGTGVQNVLEQIGHLTEFLVDSGIAAQTMRGLMDGLTLSVAALEGAYRVLNLGMDQNTGFMKEWNEQGSSMRRTLAALFSGDLDAAGEAMHGYHAVLDTTVGEQRRVEESMFSLGAATNSASDAVKELVDKYVELMGLSLGVVEAEIAFQEQIDKVAAAVAGANGKLKETNGQLDLSDAKTRELLGPLMTMANRTLAVARANSSAGVSFDVTRGKIETARKKFMDAIVTMGGTRTAAKKLADAIFGIPSGKDIHFTTNIEAVRDRIIAAQNQIAAHDPSGGRPFFAHGGVKGAANGGVRSNLTMVGEHGPELVSLPAGSRVHSNPDTRRMMAGAGGGGGGFGVVQINLDGKMLAEALVEPQRELVRTRGGGSAQQFYGQRGRG